MNKILSIAAILLATTAATAQAYDQAAIVGGIGYVEALDDKNNGVVANVEYRSAAYAPEQFFGVSDVSWIAGAELDTNQSTYGYAGLLYDAEICENWSITPSVAAGLYHQGEGKDLGGALEFRSNLEVSYKVSEQERVGVAINHKSNASLYDKNPGTETVQVVYSVELE